MENKKEKKENIILKKYIPILGKHYKIHELTKENLKKGNKFIPGHNEDFYNKKFW